VDIDEERVRAYAQAMERGWRNPVWRGRDGGFREW